MQRRDFIKTGIAAGALALGAGPFLSSCSTPDRRIKPADSPVPSLDKQRAAMLHYASLAPSGHNAQPWTVSGSGNNGFTIGFDPERTLPVVDPDNRELLLSIGTFIENLCLAAGNAGYDPEVIILSRSRTDPEVARITLHPATPKNYPFKRLEMRRTVKSGMQSREIKNSDVDKLSQPFGGRLFYFPAGTRHADCIAEGAIEAFREKGIDKTATQAREGGGWFIITSAGETVADIVDTGRRFQRMALLAREHNLAIHPMTQQLEEKESRKQITRAHEPDMIPQFILRVGYLDRYPDPVSLRRPVNRFVIGS